MDGTIKTFTCECGAWPELVLFWLLFYSACTILLMTIATIVHLFYRMTVNGMCFSTVWSMVVWG